MKKKNMKNKIIVTILMLIMMLNSFTYATEVSPDSNSPTSDPDYDTEVKPYDFINKTYDATYKAGLEDNTINFDEIEDLVHNYNPTVLSWWNSYKNNKSSNEVYEDYMDSYNSLMDQASSMESDAAAARLYAQAYAIKILADNNVSDSIINFYDYEAQEIVLWLQVKQKFFDYYTAVYDEAQGSIALSEYKRQTEGSKIKYDVGLDTELSYLENLKSKSDAEATLSLYKTNKDVAAKNLKLSCGKSIGNEISIGPLPDFDMSTVNYLNLETDVIKAIENNIYLKSYKRAYNNATTEEMKNNYQILIDYANESIASEVRTKYSTLKNAVTSYNTELLSQKLFNDQLVKAKEDYDNGKISLNEYNTAMYNSKNSEYDVKKALITVQSAYEDYKYAVEKGIAGATL